MAQITLTVNPIPADAEVKINGTIGNTSSVESGSDVSILVSKSGYSTLEIINRYTESKTVDVELQTGDDLEPTITIFPPSGSTSVIGGTKGTSKTVSTGSSVSIEVSKYNYVTYEETFIATHNIKKTIYLEEGRCWFTDNTDRIISGGEQKIRPVVEVKTDASSMGFWIGNVEYVDQQDSSDSWVRGTGKTDVKKVYTYTSGAWVSVNLSGATRRAVLKLSAQTGSPVWDTINVIQEPLSVCLVKAKIDTSYEEYSGKLSVRCASQSTSWTVKTDCSWITLSGTIGTGDITNGISYTIAANTTGTKRIGEIAIYTGSTKVYAVPVTQEVDPSIKVPSVDNNEFSIDTYEDTEIVLNISDPNEFGWKLDGYTWFDSSGKARYDSTSFKGVLNPNDYPLDSVFVQQGIDFAHPEFGTNPSTTPVERTTGLTITDRMRARTGIGDATIRVLFSRKALSRTNSMSLMDSNGDYLDKIYFIPSDEVVAQWDEEYGDHSEPIEPTGVYFKATETVLDVGGAGTYIYSYITPSDASGTKTNYFKDGSLVTWSKGRILGVKAGHSYIYGKAKKSDGTYTPESASGKLQVVIWDKNNLSQDFQFEDHKTIRLDYGETRNVKLLRKPDSKIHASDLWICPPNGIYSAVATDSSDGSINIAVTAKAKKGSAWLMVVYGSIIDRVAIAVASPSGGCRSGDGISTEGDGQCSVGNSDLWNPNHPVKHQFEYDPNAKVSPIGLTLMEGETKIIRGKRGGYGGTIYNMDKYHTVIRGNASSIQIGDLTQIDSGENGDWRYEFAVEAISPGVSYVDIAYNGDNKVMATYMIVVQGEDSALLKSIKLFTTDTNCIPGKSYNLGFTCVPGNYSIRDYNTSTGFFSDRPGVSLSPEYDDPYGCIESCSVVTNPDRAKSGNAYYSLQVKFREGSSGRVGLRLVINDNGNRKVSETAVLNISSSTTLTSGNIVFSQGSLEANLEDGVIDLSRYVSFSGMAESDSKYYWLEGSDSSGIIKFSSDGKTVIPIAPGESRLYLKYHYSGMSGDVPEVKNSGNSIVLNIKDKTAEYVESFNIRFKVREVRIDRSAKIYYKWASQSLTGSETTDFSEQLYAKYGVWTVKGLVLHDDPYGVFDNQKLVVRYENEAGQNLTNENVPGYDVAYQWAEGTVYLAAYYSTTKTTASACLDRIPFTMETKDPNFIPIRNLLIACRIPDATLSKWSDFSQWYPATKFFTVYPKDAIISSSGFAWNNSGIEGDGCRSEVVHVQKYNDSGKTFDEKYRVRLAGFGGIMIPRSWRRGGYANTGYDGGMIICWPDGTAKGNYRPNTVSITTPKNTIRRGEYTFVHATPDPDIDFAMREEMEWHYIVDGKICKTKADVNKLGTFEIICENRRGVIIRGGSVTGSHTIKVWMNLDVPKPDPSVTINLISEAFNPPSGTLELIIRKDTNGKVIDGQRAYINGGVVEGWGCDNWLLSSISQDGLIRTFTAGNVTYYAVTTDGRLAMATGQTKDTATGWEPIDPHSLLPVNPVDDTPREATAGGDSGVQLGFEDKAPIVFNSSTDEPVRRKVRKGGTTFSLSSISCAVEKPGIVSATCVIYEGSLSVQVTPLKKGTTKVYVFYGGTADYVNVEVLEGEDYVPSISYKDTTGVSLNAFEYKEVEFKAISQGIYDGVLYSSDNSKIVVDKGNYDPLTGVGTFLVTLKDKVSGKVTLQYNTERLEFQIVNRYNLAFENVSNFILGVGATRYIKIYPLDDLIQDTEVFVSSQNGNVEVGSVTESRDSVGKRVFVVPVTYKSPGPDILIASRKGDLDIYLEFDCEAKSIPASSINFNTDSINLNI